MSGHCHPGCILIYGHPGACHDRHAADCEHCMDDRIRATWLALARVGVWIAAESRARHLDSLPGSRPVGIGARRALVLAEELLDGRLRLTFPEEP